MEIFRILITAIFLLAVNFCFPEKSFADNNSKLSSNTPTNANGEYVRKRFLQLMKKPFDTDSQNSNQTKILIIGDSHAQDFLNAIAENKLLTHSQIRTRYIPTRCQIYLGDPSHREIQKNDVTLCQKSDSLEQAKAQIAEADVIILSALWRMWAVKTLPKTIANLRLSPEQKLFVIGRRSFLKPDTQVMQHLDKTKRIKLRNKVDIHQLDINTLMAKLLDEQVFVDVHNVVCGSGSSCPVFTDKAKMISFDGGHLSRDGARYLGNILFKNSQLSTLTESH